MSGPFRAHIRQRLPHCPSDSSRRQRYAGSSDERHVQTPHAHATRPPVCSENLYSSSVIRTRRPASADRTARRQFQAVFPVITGSFPTNVIAHLHGLSMDLTVGRTVGPTVDSTVGWTVGLTVKLCKYWFDSRSNYWSNCGNHWPTSEPNAG